MKTSESIKAIAGALVKFNAKVTKIAKDANNPFHKNNYATLDHIVEEIRPILNEFGLIVMQNPSGDENGNITVKTLLLHESGEWMESDGVTLKPQKHDPQGAGGAVTYARRYDLCAFLSLNTGDDDDGNYSSGHNGKAAEPKKASDKQLNLVTNLIRKNKTEKFNEQQLYELIKQRVGTQNEMEDWSAQEASKAIQILQNGKGA